MTGFQVIEKRGGAGNKKKAYGSGKETIRFKADGTASIQTDEQDESTQKGIDAINLLLDTFMGINDTELATQVDKKCDLSFGNAIFTSLFYCRSGN